MRASEFLFEYKRDITLNNYRDKLAHNLSHDYTVQSQTTILTLHNQVEALKRRLNLTDPRDKEEFNEVSTKLSNAISDVLRRFEDSDPTPNKQYTQWLVRAYINRIYQTVEDVRSNGADFLNKYYWLKVHKKLGSNMSDINRLKTREQYTEWRREIDWSYKTYAKAENLPEGKSEILLDDNVLTVYKVLDQEAACYLGQDTDWCTAVTGLDGRTNNYFNEYNKDGPLYVVIPKHPKYKGEKYQLHFESEQFMDDQDSSVAPYVLIEHYPQLHEVFHSIAVAKGVKNAFSIKLGLLNDWSETLLYIRKTIANKMTNLTDLLNWTNFAEEYSKQDGVNDWGNYVDKHSSNDIDSIKMIFKLRNEIAKAAISNIRDYGIFDVSYSALNNVLKALPKVSMKEDTYNWRNRIFYASQRTIDEILFPKDLINNRD